MGDRKVKIWKVGPLLPKPVTARSGSDVSALLKASPKSFWIQALGAWAVIILVIWLAQKLHPAFVLLAIPLIASRQNILALLIHEQAHHLCFSAKARKEWWGDLIVNLICAYPIFVEVGEYAHVHLQHHAKYFTDDDPDYLRKQGKEWSTPIAKRTLLFGFLKDLCGLSLLAMIRGKRPKKDQQHFPRVKPLPWIRPIFYIFLALVLTLTHSWSLFLIYWVLPFATVFQVFIRWGALCEHRYNLVNPPVNESTPVIILRWWEKLLYDNLNFGMHVYHHYHPGIPYHYLPKVHEMYRREGLVNDQHVFHGYWSYLKFILGSKPDI